MRTETRSPPTPNSSARNGSVATAAVAGGAVPGDTASAYALRHSSVKTTQVYAKVVDRIRENPARYLEALTG
jgi:hypothetical protein